MNELDKLIDSINTFREIEDLIKAKSFCDKLFIFNLIKSRIGNLMLLAK